MRSSQHLSLINFEKCKFRSNFHLIPRVNHVDFYLFYNIKNNTFTLLWQQSLPLIIIDNKRTWETQHVVTGRKIPVRIHTCFIDKISTHYTPVEWFPNDLTCPSHLSPSLLSSNSSNWIVRKCSNPINGTNQSVIDQNTHEWYIEWFDEKNRELCQTEVGNQW